MSLLKKYKKNINSDIFSDLSNDLGDLSSLKPKNKTAQKHQKNSSPSNTNSNQPSPTNTNISPTNSNQLSPTITNISHGDLVSEHQHSPTNTNIHQQSPIKTNSHQSSPDNTNTHQYTPTDTNSSIVYVSEKQWIIYKWLVDNRDNARYNRGILARELNISGETIKSVILKFKKIKIMTTGLYDYGSKTIPYRINFSINVKPIIENSFHQLSPINTNTHQPPPTNTNIHQLSPVTTNDHQPKSGCSYNSSSSLLYKTTTHTVEHELYDKVETELQTNKNLRYWKHKNLKAKKICTWIDETGISFEDMIESLTHCAFFLLESNEKDNKGKQIDDVFSWFWKRISKYGYYEQPANFKSQQALEIERAKKRLVEKQSELAELEKIEKEIHEVTETINFQKWWQSLSEKEQNEIDSKSQFRQRTALNVHRKTYWQNSIDKDR